jgi:hydroxyacylglutathione hydrolase
LLDPEKRIVLLIDDARVDEAVRALIRIGYDKTAGWAPTATVGELRAGGMTLAVIESIGFEELERRRIQRPLTVLDVRGASEYAERHVPNALNIAHTRLRARVQEVPRGGRIYVHCLSGARAAASAAFLAREGFDVVDVDGRFDGWQAQTGAHSQAGS